MKLTRDIIISKLNANAETLRKFGVKSLALTGSYSRHEETPSSDLDFILELETKTFDSYMDTKLFLEDLFGLKVDLVLKNTIKPRLCDSLLKDVSYVSGL